MSRAQPCLLGWDMWGLDPRRACWCLSVRQSQLQTLKPGQSLGAALRPKTFSQLRLGHASSTYSVLEVTAVCWERKAEPCLMGQG